MLVLLSIALAGTADTGLVSTADTGGGETADTASEAVLDTGPVTASMLRGETGGLGCQIRPTGGPTLLLTLAGLVVVLRTWRTA